MAKNGPRGTLELRVFLPTIKRNKEIIPPIK